MALSGLLSLWTHQGFHPGTHITGTTVSYHGLFLMLKFKDCTKARATARQLNPTPSK